MENFKRWLLDGLSFVGLLWLVTQVLRHYSTMGGM